MDTRESSIQYCIIVHIARNHMRINIASTLGRHICTHVYGIEKLMSDFLKRSIGKPYFVKYCE